MLQAQVIKFSKCQLILISKYLFNINNIKRYIKGVPNGFNFIILKRQFNFENRNQSCVIKFTLNC